MEKIVAYKEAVKAKYDIARNGVNSDYLLKPSPARLRELSGLLFEKGLNEEDLEIFNRFFVFNDKSEKIRQIRKFERDKFRPIRKFFLRESDLTQIESINLAAVLVDFELRPFLRYKDAASPESPIVKNPGKPTDVIVVQGMPDEAEAKSRMEEFENNDTKIPPRPKSSWKRKGVQLAIAILILSSGFAIKTICFPEKNCMVWKGDHYEVAKPEPGNIWVQYWPINENELKYLKKIEVCDTTTFFKNDKPIIWYGKLGGKFEYFTYPGRHPVTRKTLKEITTTIITNHVKGKGLKCNYHSLAY